MKSEMDKLKILLVDDDEDDRQFFADALEGIELNTDLHQLENGKSCMEFLLSDTKNTPDLVFLDLNMPIMNGFECLEAIRNTPHLKDLLVAIYSTSSAERDIEETFEKGANIYIKKPSSFSELKKSLKQVVKMNWAYHLNDFKKENFLLKI
ncbi:response regulator [Maribacter dokdonensis]|jgi:CheY-like chemotaxis protein|uniref:response regulator n=2 Tax=Flavobacteriaceae TaxID=49546 RepID=UPI0007270015|nr:response regulator [Maribacter dokdonensis]KSA12345.1 Two-component system-response regulator, receiver domain [Maribacter dokdonensis DSW-8]|tara:strand:+ start:1427 stop:1879 length:453 start_codon:yes stop_codon:yes gene_type:complete